MSLFLRPIQFAKDQEIQRHLENFRKLDKEIY